MRSGWSVLQFACRTWHDEIWVYVMDGQIIMANTGDNWCQRTWVASR